MNEFFSSLSPSDYVELLGIIASVLTSLVAIIISVLTLHQNSKMIEESSRPYITIYSEITYFQNTVYYLILKNFGKSSGVITSFTCDHDLSKYMYDDINFSRQPFSNIIGTFIAPNQAYRVPFDATKFEKDLILTFSIEYSSGHKVYSEKVSVNYAADAGIIHIRASTKNKELKIISYTLQDIAEHQL